MNGYQFYKFMRAMVGLVLGGVLFVFLVIREMHDIVTREEECKKVYGANWQAEYEVRYGPVEDARKKLWVGGGGVLAVGVISYFIYRQVAGNRSARRSRRHRLPN